MTSKSNQPFFSAIFYVFQNLEVEKKKKLRGQLRNIIPVTNFEHINNNILVENLTKQFS